MKRSAQARTNAQSAAKLLQARDQSFVIGVSSSFPCIYQWLRCGDDLIRVQDCQIISLGHKLEESMPTFTI